MTSMVDDVLRERTMERLDKVNVVASRRERTDEKQEVEDKSAVTAQEAANTGRWAMGRVFRWFPDEGFGFVRVGAENVSLHTSALHGHTDGIVGQRVVVKIIEDRSRVGGAFRASAAKREADFLEEQPRDKAMKAAAAAVRAS